MSLAVGWNRCHAPAEFTLPSTTAGVVYVCVCVYMERGGGWGLVCAQPMLTPVSRSSTCLNTRLRKDTPRAQKVHPFFAVCEVTRD